MNPAFEQFKTFAFFPESLFSADNPAFKNAQEAQRGLFAAFDGAAKANLSLASDLLDLNRQRVEALYDDKPLTNKVQGQADLLVESGHRFVQWSDELRDVARAYRGSIDTLVAQAGAEKAPGAKAGRKTAKAA